MPEWYRAGTPARRAGRARPPRGGRAPGGPPPPPGGPRGPRWGGGGGRPPGRPGGAPGGGRAGPPPPRPEQSAARRRPAPPARPPRRVRPGTSPASPGRWQRFASDRPRSGRRRRSRHQDGTGGRDGRIGRRGTRRVRPPATAVPGAAGDDRAAEPRRAHVLRPRPQGVRDVRGPPPRRPRCLLVRRAPRVPGHAGRGGAAAVLRASVRGPSGLDRRLPGRRGRLGRGRDDRAGRLPGDGAQAPGRRAGRSIPPTPTLPCENRRAEGTPRVGMGFARASESVFPGPRTSAPGPKGCAGGAPDVPDEEGGSGRGELAPPLLPLPLKGGGTLVLLPVALVLGFGGASPGFAAGAPGGPGGGGPTRPGAPGRHPAPAPAPPPARLGRPPPAPAPPPGTPR